MFACLVSPKSHCPFYVGSKYTSLGMEKEKRINDFPTKNIATQNTFLAVACLHPKKVGLDTSLGTP